MGFEAGFEDQLEKGSGEFLLEMLGEIGWGIDELGHSKITTRRNT